MAGLKIMANVRVQALLDYTLRVKIDNAQLVTLNGEIELTDANRMVEPIVTLFVITSHQNSKGIWKPPFW